MPATDTWPPRRSTCSARPPPDSIAVDAEANNAVLCDVPNLRMEEPSDDASRQDWQYVHNLIIPTAALSLDDVRERVHRNRLEVAYAGDDLIGCSTVRPPTSDSSTATVIVRVLPDHRRRGFGEALYARALQQAHSLGADAIETVVLESNVDGLRFAQAHGFLEVSRDLLPGDSIAFITLRLATSR